MALKDEIEAHKAAIDQARDEIAAVDRTIRQEQREPTAQEIAYVEQRRDTIRAERQQLFPKARQALRAFLNAAVERNFTAGPFAVDITEAAIVQDGWTGNDASPNGQPVPYTHVGGPMLMLRAEIRENGLVIRTPLGIHLVPEPRLFVQTGTEPNPDHDPSDPGSPSERPVYGFNLRRALRQLIATFPEVRGRLNA
jgi:hypothetical protein